ncbi:MAG: hypothetical protein GXO99_05505 [Nitrospirae bacterium]|nr:hypothetical protein [Nitrospirota bacterium]
MRSYIKGPAFILIFLGLLIFTYSCGGGGTDLFAGGGISGTGKYTGVVSGFGSIFVNGIEFDTSNATIIVEGKPGTESDLSVGMKVTVSASDSMADEVIFEPEIKGIITDIDAPANSLDVMGQTVQITTATVLSGFTSILDLAAGDHVLVSGFFDSTNTIVATYIRLLLQAPSVFEIKGYVKNLDSLNKTFEINNLRVDYSSATLSQQLNNGDFVEVKGNYSAGLFTATSVEITVPVEKGSPGDTIKVEGLITDFIAADNFQVNGLTVITTPDTKYINGTSAELTTNIWIEVHGQINSSGELVASQIEFRYNVRQEVEFKGVLDDVDQTLSTVSIFSKVVKVSSSTIFKDDSSSSIQNFTFQNLTTGDYVKIGGFVNSNGEIIATKIEKIDPVTENTLKGPVDRGSENNTIGNYSIAVLGITVDMNDPSITFEDIDDNPISMATFFNSIDDTKSPGDIVEVEGNYSQADGRFYATKVTIERIN